MVHCWIMVSGICDGTAYPYAWSVYLQAIMLAAGLGGTALPRGGQPVAGQRQDLFLAGLAPSGPSTSSGAGFGDKAGGAGLRRLHVMAAMDYVGWGYLSRCSLCGWWNYGGGCVGILPRLGIQITTHNLAGQAHQQSQGLATDYGVAPNDDP